MREKARRGEGEKYLNATEWFIFVTFSVASCPAYKDYLCADMKQREFLYIEVSFKH